MAVFVESRKFCLVHCLVHVLKNVSLAREKSHDCQPPAVQREHSDLAF